MPRESSAASPSRGIRLRLLLLVAVATVPLFAATLYQGLEARRRAGAREREDARRLVQLFAVEHRRVVADARQMLFLLAQGPTVRRAEPVLCAKLFRDVVASAPGYRDLLLADRAGVVVAAARPRDLDEADRALVARAEAETFAVGPIRRAGSSGLPSFEVAHAVLPDGGSAPHVLLASIDTGWVAREMADAGLGGLTRLTVWEPSGRTVIRHPDPEAISGRDASGSDVWRSIQSTGGEGTVEAAGADGVRRLYGFTRVKGDSAHAPLVLSLGVPSEVAYADLRRLERRNLFVLALATALAAVVAWVGGDRLVRLFQRMQRLAERDALTGLANRRHLRAVGEEELRRANRFGHPLAVVMLDLDHFKQVNDRHGHAVGDDVLKETARRIRDSVREIDLPARYGGEEFAVLLPETGLETAREAGERVRRALSATPMPTRRGPVQVTASAGVAVVDAPADDLSAVFEAADKALYEAKSSGRNRLVVSKERAA